ncbi:SDR family NAD(P)-dependent oxidoreductase [Acanthopleuribacter pedis]|uniref:SDR family oxidoreductase n=1 Tax=Acanthopleuribacter pedis TaxID=442870 RepID=A0A8J7U0I0_9BACT|nr:SDR family oxidoreductase [Acanthopleuribacter pedis]MBO1317088.1 SDR family oxidoreductase [Acanthopleuribacter pedis]
MQGRQVLITGGSAGIGLDCVRMLTEAGARVHVVARDRERLDALQNQFGEQVTTLAADLAETDAVAAVGAHLEAVGVAALDGLVINAAKYGFRSLSDCSLAELQAYFQVNAISAIQLINLTLPLLRKGEGRSIVCVSSTLATRPIAGTGAYAATKAALNSLVQTYALECAGDQIRVNAVLPGVVDTDIHEPRTDQDPPRAEKMAALGPMHPLGRVGSVRDVSALVMFLLGDQSAWTTGSLYNVDGGISLV